jgi:hypothetical protein
LNDRKRLPTVRGQKNLRFELNLLAANLLDVLFDCHQFISTAVFIPASFTLGLTAHFAGVFRWRTGACLSSC